MRTDMLERMADEGKIDINDFRVLVPEWIKSDKIIYPFMRSTRLYPEWPMAKLAGTSSDLAEKVAQSLMLIKNSDPAAKAGSYDSWSYPLNYQSVRDLEMELQVGALSGFGEITPLATLKRFMKFFIIASIFVAFLLTLLVLVVRLNKRLALTQQQLNAELSARQEAEQILAIKNKELEKSNKELDDFAYIASHDLREPLRGIMNYCTFLMEDHGDKLDADGRSKLETLMRLSGHQGNLIQALLEYSRVGRLDMALERVDLNAVVAETVESIKASFHENNIEIKVQHPLPTILCDHVRINKVFSNLVTNALKYNDKTKKTVEIGLLASFTSSKNSPSESPVKFNNNKRQVFYIKDNGIGIREQHIDKIFTIFKRLHGKDKYGGGTGIGLTIVKKIVELHHGEIWVDSTFGEGTTFYFTLQGAN